MGEMKIKDWGGSRIIEWSLDNREQVHNARNTFEQMTKKGFKAVRMENADGNGTVIKSFDPEAKQILFVPPIYGG